MGFPGGSVIRNLPAKQETWVQSPGWEGTLKKEYSSIPVRTEEPGRLQSVELQKSWT